MSSNCWPLTVKKKSVAWAIYCLEGVVAKLEIFGVSDTVNKTIAVDYVVDALEEINVQRFSSLRSTTTLKGTSLIL